ncbi:hypothetical protein LC608_31530 [Nostoc sp. XA010]|uniref:hypothetical protein n=1 Tax=Nostoc sp. XA010 TaxID=2780407 RepID=UPI001E42F944|nr:hypothetical protein [Nostoc sp. XA010]MCC5661405.1 hypothetical protein [Nostoc sp. XA010]
MEFSLQHAPQIKFQFKIQKSVLILFGRSPNHLLPDGSNTEISRITNNFKKPD